MHLYLLIDIILKIARSIIFAFYNFLLLTEYILLKLKYIWCITLSEFKMYNMLIWFIYIVILLPL